MIRAAIPDDISTILEIFNDNILNSTAIYMYEEQTLAQRMAWYEQKMQNDEPLFVYEENGEVAGYAAYGPFRAYPAYQYTVEHSVYVHKNHYKKGIAMKLMHTLIEHARTHEVKTMVACIDRENEASIYIHEKLNFTYSGTIRNAGYKFGRWLDLVFYQLDLEGPKEAKGK
ncbi:N-acetyltransferase [Solibacillus sp. R5-41]|uniref:GNAT family N-acetyltransferase n=1 Tax=Solibacillus sp. R5-41 TaxID=2048654 RepID=UPI000C1290DA|nr:GNAT family N-acetyltransferase [Solibacillus sp. R5-41]ATP42008.1 N-acetyltransferase [Solibacillus sp. R5-41]